MGKFKKIDGQVPDVGCGQDQITNGKKNKERLIKMMKRNRRMRKRMGSRSGMGTWILAGNKNGRCNCRDSNTGLQSGEHEVARFGSKSICNKHVRACERSGGRHAITQGMGKDTQWHLVKDKVGVGANCHCAQTLNMGDMVVDTFNNKSACMAKLADCKRKKNGK